MVQKRSGIFLILLLYSLSLAAETDEEYTFSHQCGETCSLCIEGNEALCLLCTDQDMIIQDVTQINTRLGHTLFPYTGSCINSTDILLDQGVFVTHKTPSLMTHHITYYMPTCPKGYKAGGNGICCPEGSSCKNCLTSDLGSCTACENDKKIYFLSYLSSWPPTPYLPEGGHCIKDCYEDQMEALSTMFGSPYCMSMTTPMFERLDMGIIEPKPLCPYNGTYYQEKTDTCENCTENCAECLSFTKCNQCLPGYYLYKGKNSEEDRCLKCDEEGQIRVTRHSIVPTCLINQECPEGTYHNKLYGICETCGNGCKRCNSEGKCRECYPQMKIGIIEDNDILDKNFYCLYDCGRYGKPFSKSNGIEYCKLRGIQEIEDSEEDPPMTGERIDVQISDA